jgi:hypothetical protein
MGCNGCNLLAIRSTLGCHNSRAPFPFRGRFRAADTAAAVLAAVVMVEAAAAVTAVVLTA